MACHTPIIRINNFVYGIAHAIVCMHNHNIISCFFFCFVSLRSIQNSVHDHEDDANETNKIHIAFLEIFDIVSVFSELNTVHH